MTNRDQVYFDISVNRENIGRVVFELFNDITPITCENFKILCTRKVPDGYQKCSFHRIITSIHLLTQILWHKVEILSKVMELVVNLSTETNSVIKIL